MTEGVVDEDTGGACSPAAQAIAVRCEKQINELARQITREAFLALPSYRELPEDVRNVEMAATVRHGLRLLLRRVRGEGDPGPDAERLFRERAAQRAEEGMPLHVLLRTHLMGRQRVWEALREAARPGEEAGLLELADLLFAGQQRQIGDIAETYLDEQAALVAERREEARSTVRALLDGTAVPAERVAGLGLSDGGTVLALRLPDGGADAAPVAARRRLRRIHATLERSLGQPVYVLLDAGEGCVVVPRRGGPRGGDGATVRDWEELVPLLADACGEDLRLALADATDAAGLAAAAGTAREVLAVARALGRGPGLYWLADVLLEYHLSRPGRSGDALGALLAPLLERPALIATLRTYIAQQQDRRATARLLGLHPNTVDNRLRTAGRLIGADLTSPRGYALALTALTAHDLRTPPAGLDHH